MQYDPRSTRRVCDWETLHTIRETPAKESSPSRARLPTYRIVAAVSAACAASVSVGNKRPPGLAVTLSGHGATEAEPPLVSRGGGHLPGAASHRRPLHER